LLKAADEVDAAVALLRPFVKDAQFTLDTYPDYDDDDKVSHDLFIEMGHLARALAFVEEHGE
jgi:hypothetical protein